jgi:hypothetical protein
MGGDCTRTPRGRLTAHILFALYLSTALGKRMWPCWPCFCGAPKARQLLEGLCRDALPGRCGLPTALAACLWPLCRAILTPVLLGCWGTPCGCTSCEWRAVLALGVSWRLSIRSVRVEPLSRWYCARVLMSKGRGHLGSTPTTAQPAGARPQAPHSHCTHGRG